jgi:multicomponent Na+:H+ antiporter subunit E
MMADTVTLLPGTLSANLEDHVLVVHVLNAGAPNREVLEDLEQRVADLFGLENEATAS